MKKSIFFNGIVLFFGLLFFNFKNAPTAPIENIIIDFTLEEFVECANNGAGEVVEFSGQLHILVVSNVNSQRISGFAHFQPLGLQGRGQSTGHLYNATGVSMERFNSSFVNGQSTNLY